MGAVKLKLHLNLFKISIKRIDWEKINWKDKGLINLPYVIGYYFGAKTDKMSIAKTYEDENTMIVTLQIPKSDYKNKSFQNLLKCPELPVQDEYYYRDWAVHMVMAGENEKTVLFSHGRITLDVKDNAKADYVTVKVVVKQKEDMLRGVVFGLKLDETYKEAWEKVMNPVGLNVVVPVVALSSEVVLTGIKNAKEITEDEDFSESGIGVKEYATTTHVSSSGIVHGGSGRSFAPSTKGSTNYNGTIGVAWVRDFESSPITFSEVLGDMYIYEVDFLTYKQVAAILAVSKDESVFKNLLNLVITGVPSYIIAKEIAEALKITTEPLLGITSIAVSIVVSLGWDAFMKLERSVMDSKFKTMDEVKQNEYMKVIFLKKRNTTVRDFSIIAKSITIDNPCPEKWGTWHNNKIAVVDGKFK